MTKICPVPNCNAPMEWNTQGLAKNPKSPHWKCTNPNCKNVLDKGTNTYIRGMYRTGVWASPEELQNAPVNQFSASVDNFHKETQIKEMHAEKQESITLSVAKNNATLVVCEFIKAGMPEPEVVKLFNKWVDIIYKKQAPSKTFEEDVDEMFTDKAI